MQIKPDEVDTITTLGTLYNDDVKLVRTLGGFYVAIGRKDRYNKEASPLAAGSHKALVEHQLEKQFKGEFHAEMNKSESEMEPIVKEYTHELSAKYVNQGYDIYSLTKSNTINVVVTKLGSEVINLEGNLTLNGVDSLKVVSNTQLNKSEFFSEVCRVMTKIVNEDG